MSRFLESDLNALNGEPMTTNRISVWIPGKPVAQPRPRLGARHAYDNGKADPWKDRVRMMAAAASQGAPIGSWPVEGAVRVELEFGLDFEPTRKPDVDNLAKAVLDALGASRADRGRYAALLWHDDAQVVELVVTKRRGEPGCRLTVCELTSEPLPVQMGARPEPAPM